MAVFLKIVSILYLGLVWYAFALSVSITNTSGIQVVFKPYSILAALAASVVAALIYGFGQIVGDVRAMRGHLKAMRAYYEPRQ